MTTITKLSTPAPTTADYMRLHFVVLIWGFTAILGKLISLPAAELVTYRMFLAALGMWIWAKWKGVSLQLSVRSALPLVGVGALVALHWVTFFAAIKVSNVAVTVGCLASATLFTAIIEPIVERRSIFWVEVVLGLGIIVGLYIITHFALHYWQGIILALFSAFVSSIFGVMNKQFRANYHPLAISFYEIAAGAVLVAIYTMLWGGGFSALPWQLAPSDLIWLCILAWLCTTYAFVSSVDLLKSLSAYIVAMAINLEPVYSIILAYFIFGESEKMNAGFYIGTLLVLLVIFSHPFLDRHFKKTAV